jgi:transposase
MQTTKSVVAHSVRRWKERYHLIEEKDMNEKGKKLNEKHISCIKRLHRMSEGTTPSVRDTHLHLKREHPNLDISLYSVWKFMHDKLNIRYQKDLSFARLSNTTSNKLRRKLVLMKIIETISSNFNITFIDESGLLKIKSCNHSWVMKGDQVRKEQPKRERNHTLIAALDLDGNCAYEVITSACNQDKFIDFIKNYVEHLRSISRKAIIFFMDNAKFHKTEKIKDFLFANNVYCIYNSPYTPHINIIEYYFGYVKCWLRKRHLLTRYEIKLSCVNAKFLL